MLLLSLSKIREVAPSIEHLLSFFQVLIRTLPIELTLFLANFGFQQVKNQFDLGFFTPNQTARDQEASQAPLIIVAVLAPVF